MKITEYTWKEYQTMKANKYKNVITEVDGIKFHSKAEAKYYGILKLKKIAGLIVSFEMQVPYEFVINGVLIGKYVADFVIQHKDRKEVIDVKGMKTPVYNLKKKLMKAVYGIEIIEIK